MSTKKKPERNGGAPAREDDFDPETEQDIEAFLGGASADAVVSVYRVGKPGEKDGFLDIMSMGALGTTPEPVLRDTYGPGTYKLRLRAPDRAGSLKFAGSRTIVIADRSPGASNGKPGAPVITNSSDEVARTHQLLLTMIANNRPPQLDLGGLAALITAVTGGNKQSDLAGVVQAFATLKQTAEPKDNLEQVTKVLDLARAINTPAAAVAAGDAEADTSWPGLIKGAISALTGAGRPQGQLQLQPAPVNAGDPAAGEFEDDESQEQGEATMQQWLQGQLAFLKTKAKTGKPVEFWIKYTVDNADEVGNTALFDALKQGATFDHLLMFDPEIANNPTLRVWFQQFYDGLKRSLSPAAPLPWIGRDITNPAGNANPGQDGQPTPGGAAGSAPPGQPPSS